MYCLCIMFRDNQERHPHPRTGITGNLCEKLSTSRIYRFTSWESFVSSAVTVVQMSPKLLWNQHVLHTKPEGLYIEPVSAMWAICQDHHSTNALWDSLLHLNKSTIWEPSIPLHLVLYSKSLIPQTCVHLLECKMYIVSAIWESSAMYMYSMLQVDQLLD